MKNWSIDFYGGCIVAIRGNISLGDLSLILNTIVPHTYILNYDLAKTCNYAFVFTHPSYTYEELEHIIGDEIE
jgi:hypothetical protein